MKKTRLLWLALLIVCLCATASAASLISGKGPDGRVPIVSVRDAHGIVTALTDSDSTTTWTRNSTVRPDLTIELQGASVGEIWLQSGHCYSENYFNHYDRPGSIAVTLWYATGRYTTDYVTYRYSLANEFRPYERSANWADGYQRLLLPQRLDGVTRIELTIESVIQGYGRTGVTLTDIAVTRGSHATATPRNATATPKPVKQYITPTPSPVVELITPRPTAEIVVPTRDVVIIPPETTDPLVEFITPKPTDEPVFFPSKGIQAKLTRSVATRTGPGTEYDEPGTFFRAGDPINVISKVWDGNNDLYWLQVEFYADKCWQRAYTTQNYVDINTALVPAENVNAQKYMMIAEHRAYYGPGEEFGYRRGSPVPVDTPVKVFLREDDWAQVEYYDWGLETVRRAWVKVDSMVKPIE